MTFLWFSSTILLAQHFLEGAGKFRIQPKTHNCVQQVSEESLLDPMRRPTLAAPEMPCPACRGHFDELNKNDDNPNKFKLCGSWEKGKKFRKIGQLIIYSFT